MAHFDSTRNGYRVRVRPVVLDEQTAHVAAPGETPNAFGVYTTSGPRDLEMWEADFDTEENATDYARVILNGDPL